MKSHLNNDDEEEEKKTDIKSKSSSLHHHHHQHESSSHLEETAKLSLDETIKDEEEQIFVTQSSRSSSISKSFINRAIDSNAVIAFMSFITTYAIYGDDVRILAFDPGADPIFIVFSSIAFALFLIEITLLCWCRNNYLKQPDLVALQELLTLHSWRTRKSTWSWLGEIGKASQTGSFYFWLDLISTFSMAIEMPWFFQITTGGDDVAGGSTTIDSTIAGKASMAGAKAANKLRVIRMVRLIRLAKLYKYFSTKQSAKMNPSTAVDNNSNSSSIRNVEGGLDIIPPESHVGAEMSDRTTKKVIVGILIMLLGIPLLQADEVDYLNEFSMKMTFEHRKFITLNTPPGIIDENELGQWEFSQSLLIDTTDCIDITYNGFEDGLPNDGIIPIDRSRIQDLRVEELDVITISDMDYVRSMTVVFDATERKREEALLGILLTSFVIVLLGLGMVSFTKDVRNLVIVPIEHMIQLVREISENPLGKDLSFNLDDKRRKDDGMETTLLIRTISKIAGLMRVGFGEAGADIIGKNLNITQGTDTMNLLGNGRKIHSIFGFCDVRQFTDTTECLQEEVMLFVNRIAHILHSIVVQCDGAANKNIGDAFLLTWKVDTDKIGTGSYRCEDHNYSADKALYSFVKTMIEMTRHEDFLCKFSPRALSELFERMPGYKCRIGCGLHFGWAIEGAIGSSKKIDASYISPHVNMSETLESTTKEYGTSILMSEPFYNLLSPEAIAGCRKVDVNPSLYTYDVDLSVGFDDHHNKRKAIANQHNHHSKTRFHRKTAISLVDPPPRSRKSTAIHQQQQHNHRQQDVTIRGGGSSGGVNGAGSSADGLGDLPTIKVSNNFPNIWRKDEDVIRARSHFSSRQREVWSLGMKAYEDGQWDVAGKHFSDVLEQSRGKDGPSLYLLKRLKEYNFTAPK